MKLFLAIIFGLVAFLYAYQFVMVLESEESWPNKLFAGMLALFATAASVYYLE